MKKIYLFLEKIILTFIKLVPAKALAHIKQNVNIIKKMDYKPHDIFLHIDSTFEYNARLTSCRKEPETVQWIELFLRPGEVFYDIGANVGAYSLIAAKFFSGNIKIYSFEPASMSYAQLCKNITLNTCENCVFPMSVAVSERTGAEIFNYHNLTTGSSIHALGEPIDHKGRLFKPAANHMVLSYSIDDLTKRLNIPPPNHIKIDVDGIEFKILKGAEDTLRNSLLKSMIIEKGKNTEDIIEFLLQRGFSLHSRHNTNDIFVRQI